MTRNCVAAFLVVTLALGSIAWADETEKAIAGLMAKTNNGLALLTYKTKDGDAGGGQAFCIDPAGTFVSTYIDPSLKTDQIAEMQIILPGKEAVTVKATLLGVDPATSLGFVQVDDKEKAEKKLTFAAIEFVPEAKLNIGQQVFSVGVMAGDGNRTPYVGQAYVSAILRVPGPLVFVTGGKLTNICSPVFTADGKAVGIVTRQMPLTYQTDTQQGPQNLYLRGVEETSFFVPSEEFVSVLKKENWPKVGEVRRLPWIGVNKFEPVNDDNAKLRGIKAEQLPAVIVDQVIPGEPGAKAGLKDNDIILEIDGKKFETLANPNLVVSNLMRQMMKYQMGQKVKLTVLSGADKKTIEVAVGPMPQLPNEAKQIPDQQLGMLLREKVPLDIHLLKGMASSQDGLLVLGVGQNSPAQQRGIAAGDLVTHVNDQAVRTCLSYKNLIEAAIKAKQDIRLTLYHGDSKQPQSVVFAIKP